MEDREYLSVSRVQKELNMCPVKQKLDGERRKCKECGFNEGHEVYNPIVFDYCSDCWDKHYKGMIEIKLECPTCKKLHKAWTFVTPLCLTCYIVDAYGEEELYAFHFGRKVPVFCINCMLVLFCKFPVVCPTLKNVLDSFDLDI